ncbi:heavy metal translocating P-type ATPase [uncultured Alistipes sp.]|uniref:heavy metal translocating P-type ATPase n=1 Tax=uncultured Alistipes sp. TaxID=538949 RepID=UPI00260377CA|nr:heavy metal translocating P-type ATPase [uncultured Alistipes sp.]
MKNQSEERSCRSGACAAHNDHTHSQNIWGAAVSALLFITGLILQYTEVPFFSLPAIRLCWYLAAYLPVGLPVLLEAWDGFRNKDFFTEHTLMSIAAFGAFFIGEYPEGVAVMLFYSIGEGLQERAVRRVRQNIRELVDIRPDQATLWSDKGSSTLPAAEVLPGQTIEVRPGERVPLDGTLLSDDAPFNTAALTGESIPRTIHTGEEVLAGMIAAENPVRIRTTRPYGESALSRILTMVEEASSRKARTELFIRRFARIYTPIVTGLALLIVALPWLWSLIHPAFVFSFDQWLSRALVFLVTSCPCALVISVPLGYFSGIGIASKAGILFKGGNSLETIARVDTVIFDKTGTLTEGRFEVTEVHSTDDSQKKQLIRAIASAEQTSTHPVARAIIRYAEEQGIQLQPQTNAAETAGYGIRATISGQEVLVGNTRLLDRFAINYPTEINTIPETIVVCAIDKRYAGYILIADTPKADAARAVSELKSLGIGDIRILSGDRQSLVQKLGERLGTTTATGDLLPGDKMRILEELKGDSDHTTAFVGDGFNDAPALAISDIGIAMGQLGSDAAIETADVVIQSDQPSRIPTAIRIGHLTRRIVRQNIIFALGIKAVVLTLGAAGIANMWEAVFADVGVTLLAVLNVVRVSAHRFK